MVIFVLCLVSIFYRVNINLSMRGNSMINTPFLQKKNLYSSAFLMILLINLCSIIVLSIFNYYVFHRMNDKAYLSSFISYNQSITDIAFNNIDKQIMQPTLSIPAIYFSPIKENDPLLLPQEEQIIKSQKKTRDLITEMKKIKKNYPYIKSIDIYYEATQTIVTNFDKVHFPQDERLESEYLPWYMKNKKEDISSEFIWQPDGIYLEEDSVITYINRISRPKWNGQDIILAIHVDPLNFGEYINQEEGNLAILKGNDRILYDSSSGQDGGHHIEDILKYVEAQNIDLKKDETPFSMKSQDGSVMVFHTVSPVSGLTYFYSINNNRFYDEYNVTNQMFVMNFIISVVFNIMVLVLISYYNYATYRRRVLTLSKNAGIAIEESDKSFDESVTVLTEEITMLHATINSSKTLLFQSAVRSMILNRNTEDAYDELEPYLVGDSVCTFLFYISEKETEHIPVEEIQGKYPLGKEEYNALFTTIDRDGLVAVLFFEDSDRDKVCGDFIQRMNGYWGSCRMVSGLTFFIQKDGIKNSYKSAVEAARYRYIFTQEKVLFYEDIHIEKRKGHGSHLKLFEAMVKAINSENFLDFKLQMELLVTSFKSGNYTMDYCISTLRDLVTLLYQMMEYHQLDMWVVFGYDIRAYYKQVRNIDLFYEWSCGLCEVILKNIRQKKKTVSTDMQARVIRLVEDNLENNISLDFLADQLHMRQDTASRMFRDVMGRSYTDYIKTRKLDRAIELMEENYSIKDIASKLGYSSAQYFIKVFKESYGITPHQYKKNRETEKEKF